MTVLEDASADVNEVILEIIDVALAEYSGRSLVSSDEIIDILLDIRRNVTDGGNSSDNVQQLQSQ